MLSKIIREKAIEAIESLHGIRCTDRDFQVSPTKPEFEGDYTIVLFSLIKQLKSSPEALGNALGNKMIAANAQRKVLSMMGDISPTAKRPTMALPAQRIVGNTK